MRGESSEYLLVALDIGISQLEFLFEGNLIARPDLMTGSQPHRKESQDAVSTKRLMMLKSLLNLRIQ